MTRTDSEWQGTLTKTYMGHDIAVWSELADVGRQFLLGPLPRVPDV